MPNKGLIRLRVISLAMALLAVAASAVSAAEFKLKAEATTVTMPDGQVIAMWGFGFNYAATDQVSVPGPVLKVPPRDTALAITLTNNLKVPVSLVIPGQITNMNPVWDDGSKNHRKKDEYESRVMSFTNETAPGQTRTYLWNNLKPGTYLYESGTNPAVQVQMGLYGALKADAKRKMVYGDKTSRYRSDVILLFSEIDPAFHEAVATGQYGPKKAVTSAVDHAPKYFLINGKAYPDTELAAIDAGKANRSVLLRFLNAGLDTHVPALLGGLYMKILAEDGFKAPYVKEQSTLELTAGKTFDVIIRSKSPGKIALYDRRLNLSNAGKPDPGGMLTFLQFQ
jgi:FtsP/CotA-like multicopper oxidase with cupredoxin domain